MLNVDDSYNLIMYLMNAYRPAIMAACLTSFEKSN